MKLKLKIGVPSKEALVTGMLMAAGECVVSEIYRTYIDIDPIKPIRDKIKAKQSKKRFDKIMAQTNLKEESAS